MTKIFDDAKDKFVNAVVLYPDDNSILHYEAESEDDGISIEDLEELFTKGLVLVAGENGTMYRPDTFTKTENYATVQIGVNTVFGSAGYGEAGL